MATLSAAQSTLEAASRTPDITKNDLRTKISRLVLSAKMGLSFGLQSVQRLYEATLPHVQAAKKPISFMIKNIAPTALLTTLIYVTTTKARKLLIQLDSIIKLQEQLTNTLLQLQSAATANKVSIDTLSVKLQKELDAAALQLKTAIADSQASIDSRSIKLQKELNDTTLQLQTTIANNKASLETDTKQLQTAIAANRSILNYLENTLHISEEARVKNSNSLSLTNIYRGVVNICVAVGLKEVVTNVLGFMANEVNLTAPSAPSIS